MDAKKLTPWFPPEVKPVHVGWYERQHLAGFFHFFTWWNGEYFQCSEDEPDCAFCQNQPWRGLAEPPRGK